MNERLNKVLARVGLSSRRGADRLIEEGRVQVNGRIVLDLGLRVDPERDAIRVDGKRLSAAPRSFTLEEDRERTSMRIVPQGVKGS